MPAGNLAQWVWNQESAKINFVTFQKLSQDLGQQLYPMEFRGKATAFLLKYLDNNLLMQNERENPYSSLPMEFVHYHWKLSSLSWNVSASLSLIYPFCPML